MADNYVNTRTIMGNQEAFDALIAGELEDLVEDGVLSLADERVLYRDNYITTLKFPNLSSSMGQYAITNCKNLKTIDIGNKCTFKTNSFEDNPKLSSLVLRGTEVYRNDSYYLLRNTLIDSGFGGIFVPSNLVSEYKAHAIWSSYAIFSIDEYPKNSVETISDSWNEIFANEDNGTYKTKYNLRDTKKITIDNTDYYAQIVAFDSDDLSDGTGKAKITWIFRQLYGAEYSATSYSTGYTSWPASVIRSWLMDTVFPLFPSDVKSAIKEVVKISYDGTTSADVTSNDKLWIPSAREVSISNTSSTYPRESSGPSYASDVFINGRHRIRCLGVENRPWWLRSATYGSQTYQIVENGGEIGQYNSSMSSGVCIGFCT